MNEKKGGGGKHDRMISKEREKAKERGGVRITVRGGEVNEEPVYDGRYSLGIGEIDGGRAPLWSLATEPEESGAVAN